jgi:hypothetical protein
MEHWIQFLIPLAFGVVWVINALMNKETTPPPRGLSPSTRTGGTLPPAPRPTPRDAPQRFSQPQPPLPTTTRRSVEDDIIVISGDSNRPIRPQSRPTAASAQRRPARTKAAQPAPAQRRPEPVPDRSLGTKVSQSVSQTIDRPLELRPLSETMSAAGASGSASQAIAPTAVPNPASVEIRRLFSSPGNLRNAFILSELLQPPPSMRVRRSR